LLEICKSEKAPSKSRGHVIYLRNAQERERVPAAGAGASIYDNFNDAPPDSDQASRWFRAALSALRRPRRERDELEAEEVEKADANEKASIASVAKLLGGE